MWAIIGTWAMVYEGILKASSSLAADGNSKEAIELAITDVEDNPGFKSVGYGGLPNKEMEVELDAGFMDGDDFSIGAVMGVKTIANPLKVAMALSRENLNNCLVGAGAEKYALDHGFESKEMLTDRARMKYEEKLKESYPTENLEAYDDSNYDGPDTVCVCAMDTSSNISVGTSTSGLFMKHPGRVGDTGFVGSGFYADSDYGAAAATGVGEDLMRGVISYEVVRNMKNGFTAQEACEKAMNEIDTKLKSKRDISDMSIIAIDINGNMGVATNTEEFSFVFASEAMAPKIYLAKNKNGQKSIEIASDQWIHDYMEKRK